MSENSKSNAYRIIIQFNIDDELQRQCLNFLALCGYKKNQVISLMVKEFIETYNFNVESMTNDDIKKFLDSYNYIQNFKRSNNGYMMSMPPFNFINNNQNYLSENGETPYIQSEDVSSDKNKKAVHAPSIPTSEEEDIAMLNQMPNNFNDIIEDDIEIDTDMANKVLSVFGL